MKAKKLIEVAMPIKEISAESVRDKSIRHGHISTLHLWWARRPLPVCRAVIFASLVPDPLDAHCPLAFKDAVELLLGKNANKLNGDPYNTYADIPWTTVLDPMEDNLRNRLQMFIGKFTPQMEQHLMGKTEKPDASKQLTDFSLIKWDSKNNETIIGIARKLIFVSYQSVLQTEKTAIELLAQFDALYNAIKISEQNLYALIDRHINSTQVALLEQTLADAIENFLDKMPRVFDPFAGGGAIPLEAARLGCRSFGNDINPVAHIIQKGSLEFPQKFGKPIQYSKDEFTNVYGEDEWNKLQNADLVYELGNAIAVKIANRLSFDVSFYAKKILSQVEIQISKLYPADEKGVKPVAYYWARVGTCSNPSCNAKVPLLRGFYLANTKSKKIYLNPIINGNKVDFEIKTGIYNEDELKGWIKAANLTCPCCGSFTEVKKLREQFINRTTEERLIAVIYEGANTKEYRIPTKKEIEDISVTKVNVNRPTEKLPIEYTGKFPRPWGFNTWGDLYSDRQLQSIQVLIATLDKYKADLSNEYGRAIVTYISFLIDKISVLITNLGRWDSTTEHGQSPFSRQAIAMTFDYPEYNPIFIAQAQLDWILRFLSEESSNPFSVILNNSSSGEKTQFDEKYLTAVITDPPYYDAIPYADLSDIFYVWQKRSIGDIYPLNFATPQTPKTDECTALKHYHNGNKIDAKIHFENKLLQIFDAIEHQTSEIVSIMFAHQSTEAWTTLCNSILGSRMNITGSWAIDTELSNRPLALIKAALSSSVTVSCTPSKQHGFGAFREVKTAIENSVAKEVDALYKLGFRGADLLTACFGKAVSEFGKYESVEKADGTAVSVAELLEITKESAFNALLKGFDGDDFTKFYIGWLQLYGFVESSFDDAAKFSRVGLSINVSDLFTAHVLIKNGNKQTLGNFEERLAADKHLGEKTDSYLIDQVHRAMFLYHQGNRPELLKYISKFADSAENSFWRVLTAIDELLIKDCNDQKQTKGLIANKESLIRDCKKEQTEKVEQATLGF